MQDGFPADLDHRFGNLVREFPHPRPTSCGKDNGLRDHASSFLTYVSIRFIASWSFTRLVAKQQRAKPSPDSPKALPGTTATFISFKRPKQNSRLVRLVGRISGNT